MTRGIAGLFILCACAIALLRIQVPPATLQSVPIPPACHRLARGQSSCEWDVEYVSPYADVKALDEEMAIEEVTGAR